MPTPEEKLLTEIREKLDIVIRLLATQVGSDLSLSERAPILSRQGLDRNMIADVCGSTPAVISVRLAEAKKKRKTSKGRRSKRKSIEVVTTEQGS